MRPFLITAAAWPLLCCSPALAQVGTVTPPIGATSPFGAVAGAAFGMTGIPMGATGLASPAVSSRALRCHGHDYHSKHKQRHGVLDRGDFAIGDVRIPRDLRRRRNGNRNRDVRHRGSVRQHGDVGHDGAVGNINVVGSIDVVGNLRDVGIVDILGNAGNVGIVGNVRLRIEQHCLIFVSNVFVSNVNVDRLAERQRPSRSSVGFLRDWQSWDQSHNSAADDSVLPITGSVGSSAPSIPTMPTVSSTPRFICDHQHFP